MAASACGTTPRGPRCRIAAVHDESPSGKGPADETRRIPGAKAPPRALFEGIDPGEKDGSALVSTLKAATVEVACCGGHRIEARLMGDDGPAPKAFVQIAGDAAEGTPMTFSPDARKNPNAQAVVAAFIARGIDRSSLWL